MTDPTTASAPELTAADLDEMQARCDVATRGPWLSTDTEHGDWIVEIPSDGFSTIELLDFGDMESNSGQDIVNANFIAHARDDLPRLIAAARAGLAQQALVDAAEAYADAKAAYRAVLDDVEHRNAAALRLIDAGNALDRIVAAAVLRDTEAGT